MDIFVASSKKTPYEFGARPELDFDSAAYLQQWIFWCEANGNRVEWPEDSFYASIPLYQQKNIPMVGQGHGRSVLVSRGQPAIVVLVRAEGDRRFRKWEGFSLRPHTVGGQTSGLYIQLQEPGAFMNMWDINEVEIGNFGRAGLLFENRPMNNDGIFTGAIDRCWIEGGIFCNWWGDSNTIKRSTITGPNCGIELTGIPGARQTTVEDCNITTSGGAIKTVGVEQLNLRNLQLEHPGYLGPYTGDTDSFVYVSGGRLVDIDNCTVNPNNVPSGMTHNIAASAITLDNDTHKAEIRHSDINKGRLFHVNAGPSVTKAYLRNTNSYYGQVLAVSGPVTVEAAY